MSEGELTQAEVDAFENADFTAFPYNNDTEITGLTKREYIATRMLQSLIAKEGALYDPRGQAIQAVELANALLLELAKW